LGETVKINKHVADGEKKLKSISMQHILVHATCTASKQLE
jgi:hypothetical protein